MSFPRVRNPALNLEAFAVQSPSPAPPPINAVYLRDGQYDGMTRADVAATFAAFKSQSATDRLALFFHGGLVDKASGQQSAANEYAPIWAMRFRSSSSGNLDSARCLRTTCLLSLRRRSLDGARPCEQSHRSEGCGKAAQTATTEAVQPDVCPTICIEQ